MNRYLTRMGLVLSLCVVVGVLSGRAQAGVVTVDQDFSYGAQAVLNLDSTYVPLAKPFLSLTPDSISNPTGDTSSASYHISDAGFHVNFNHVLGGSSGEHYADSTATVLFEPSADLTYVATGSYSSPASISRFEVSLYEFDADWNPTPIFDTLTVPAGGITGTLSAGTWYQFSFDAFSDNNPALPAGSSASGFADLALVPLPSAAWMGLVLLGAVGCIAKLRAVRRSQTV